LSKSDSLHHHLCHHSRLVDLKRSDSYDQQHEKDNASNKSIFLVILHLHVTKWVHSLNLWFNRWFQHNVVEAMHWWNHKIDHDKDSMNLLRREKYLHWQRAHHENHQHTWSMSFFLLLMNERNDSWWKSEMIELKWLFELRENNSMTSAKSSCLLMMFFSCIVDFSHFNH